MTLVWRSQDDSVESVLSIHLQMGAGVQTQVSKLSLELCYPLGHLPALPLPYKGTYIPLWRSHPIDFI